MPTPGFPEWLGPGAVLQRRIARSDVTSHFVVMELHLQLAWLPGSNGGAFSIVICPLDYERRIVLEDTPLREINNLPALLAMWQWTGEYLTPDRNIVAMGTAPRVEESETAERAREAEEQLMNALLATPDVVREQIMRDLTALNELRPDPQRVAEGWAMLDIEPGQVWRLSVPNEGMWRVTLQPSDPRNPIILTHVREPDRQIRCSATWLSEHGVRHEPPDSRIANQPSQVVIGSLWEIPSEQLPRYRQVARWRVHQIQTDSVILMSDDDACKRLYWPITRLTSVGTYVGDGLPRRTAYERLLHEDEDSI